MLLSASNSSLPPRVENEHGQVVDERILKATRLKIGSAACVNTVMGSLGPNLSTVIIRMFGGTDFHIGLWSAFQSASHLFQFLGSMVLKAVKSNKRGYFLSCLPGLILGPIGAWCVYNGDAAWKETAFLVWFGTVLFMAPLVAITSNVETSWVGDLVPREKLGWFFSFKWISVNIAAIVGGLTLAKIADINPTPSGYALITICGWFAGIVGLIIYMSVPDRTPKCTNFFKAGTNADDRIQYKSKALWSYISFYVLWAAGRSLLITFVPIFLIEKFNFSMSKLVWLTTLQLIVSSIVIHILGKISDKKGNRIILMLTSGLVAFCMLLWVSAAWWGLIPIIAYTIINGAAGQTHSMLATNYAIEIFPDKGRSAYLAFGRFFIGAASIAAPFFAGWVMATFKDIHLTFGEVTLDRYYLCFLTGALLTLTCVIPLLVVGKRKVGDV